MIRFKYFERDGLKDYIYDIINEYCDDSYELSVDLENGDFILDVKDIDHGIHDRYVGVIPIPLYIDEWGGYCEHGISDHHKCYSDIRKDISDKLHKYRSENYLTKTEAIKTYGKDIIDRGFGFIGSLPNSNQKYKDFCLYDKNVIEYHIRQMKHLTAFCFVCRNYYDPDTYDGLNVDLTINCENNKYGHYFSNHTYKSTQNICPDCLSKVFNALNIANIDFTKKDK